MCLYFSVLANDSNKSFKKHTNWPCEIIKYPLPRNIYTQIRQKKAFNCNKYPQNKISTSLSFLPHNSTNSRGKKRIRTKSVPFPLLPRAQIDSQFKFFNGANSAFEIALRAPYFVRPTHICAILLQFLLPWKRRAVGWFVLFFFFHFFRRKIHLEATLFPLFVFVLLLFRSSA